MWRTIRVQKNIACTYFQELKTAMNEELPEVGAWRVQKRKHAACPAQWLGLQTKNYAQIA
jgi:hypothetical protein